PRQEQILKDSGDSPVLLLRFRQGHICRGACLLLPDLLQGSTSAGQGRDGRLPGPFTLCDRTQPFLETDAFLRAQHALPDAAQQEARRLGAVNVVVPALLAVALLI